MQTLFAAFLKWLDVHAHAHTQPIVFHTFELEVILILFFYLFCFNYSRRRWRRRWGWWWWWWRWNALQGSSPDVVLGSDEAGRGRRGCGGGPGAVWRWLRIRRKKKRCSSAQSRSALNPPSYICKKYWTLFCFLCFLNVIFSDMYSADISMIKVYFKKKKESWSIHTVVLCVIFFQWAQTRHIPVAWFLSPSVNSAELTY